MRSLNARIRFLCLVMLPLTVRSAELGSDDKLGAVQGIVKFPGETPPPAMYANRDDAACPRGIGENHLVVKQTTLGLRNALIILEGSQARAAPVGRATLESRDCTLAPRLQSVTTGTSLQLRSVGMARHHLHVFRDGQRVFEADLPVDGTALRRPLVDPGLYKVNCDRHLWERAWIYVTAGEPVALSDAEGKFSMHGIAPGRYHLRAWHEGWLDRDPDASGRPEYRPETQRLDVKISAGRTTPVTIDHLEPAPDGGLR